MYIKLTDRCNMACEHCGFAATKNGKDMPMEVFEKAMSFAEYDYVTLGGGEPTLHPNFPQILFESIASCESVHVITNGTNYKYSMLMAKLSEKEIMGAELSWDEYHDQRMVHDDVYYAFAKKDGGYNRLRKAEQIIPVGRAEEWGWEDSCICEDIVITPSGDVFACGCMTHKLGTVYDWDGRSPYNGECPNRMEEDHEDD